MIKVPFEDIFSDKIFALEEGSFLRTNWKLVTWYLRIIISVYSFVHSFTYLKVH